MTDLTPLQTARPHRRGRSSPAILPCAARERAAIALRTQGASFDDVADQVGYADRSGARKAVERGMSRWMRETDEELRARELARSEIVIDRLMPLIDRDEPDHKAVDSLIKVMNQRAKLAGLNNKRPPAPPEVDPDTPDPAEKKVQAVQNCRKFVEQLRGMEWWQIQSLIPYQPGDDDEEDDFDDDGRAGVDAPYAPDDHQPSHNGELDECDENEDDDEDEVPGRWIDARFYPDTIEPGTTRLRRAPVHEGTGPGPAGSLTDGLYKPAPQL